MTEFFLVALPGLEDIVKGELAEWFPGLEATVSHGGVTVHAPLAVGLSFNLALKTPTRVLVRVASARIRDFPKLYAFVREMDWRRWIAPTCELRVHSSTRLSRLKIKRRIEETCEDGWRAYQKDLGAITKRGQRVDLYVRFVEDVCTLSLDTSGERLHKRGERTHIGEAPLRETIAACLIALVNSTEREMPQVEVVDPMMGSGTFLLEAAGRSQLVASRDFAFENFTAGAVTEPVLKVVRPQVMSLVGFEADKKTLAAARENLKGVAGQVQLLNADIFSAEPLPPAAGARWVFCNPPYGERLKVKEPLGAYYQRLFAAVERVAQPSRACFLLPSKAVKGKFILPSRWKVLAKRPFVNGGIPVTAFVFG